MLVTDAYGVEYHLNPHQIVLTRTMSDGDGEVELANGETFWPDLESYERIVAWMERQTSTWSYMPFKEFGGTQ